MSYEETTPPFVLPLSVQSGLTQDVTIVDAHWTVVARIKNSKGKEFAEQIVSKVNEVSNHVFTCSGCGRQWTVHSTSVLECFFVGLCYWCITEGGLSKHKIDRRLRDLLQPAEKDKNTMTSKAQTLHIFGQVVGSQAVVIGLRSPKEEGAIVPRAQIFIDDPAGAQSYLMTLHSDGYRLQGNRQSRRVCDYLTRETPVDPYIADFAREQVAESVVA